MIAVGDVVLSGSVLDRTVIVQKKDGQCRSKLRSKHAQRSRMEGIHDLSRRKSNTAAEYADLEGRPIHEAD